MNSSPPAESTSPKSEIKSEAGKSENKSTLKQAKSPKDEPVAEKKRKQSLSPGEKPLKITKRVSKEKQPKRTSRGSVISRFFSTKSLKTKDKKSRIVREREARLNKRPSKSINSGNSGSSSPKGKPRRTKEITIWTRLQAFVMLLLWILFTVFDKTRRIVKLSIVALQKEAVQNRFKQFLFFDDHLLGPTFVETVGEVYSINETIIDNFDTFYGLFQQIKTNLLVSLIDV